MTQRCAELKSRMPKFVEGSQVGSLIRRPEFRQLMEIKQKCKELGISCDSCPANK